MVISIDPAARVPYVCAADLDLPVEQRTTFWIRDLTYRENEALEEQQLTRTEVMLADGSRAQTIQPHMARTKRLALQAGLVGWENLRNEAGELVAFKAGKEESILGRLCKPPTDETLERLSGELRDELGNVIQMRARLDADARKKLLSLQPSPSTSSSTSATAAPAG